LWKHIVRLSASLNDYCFWSIGDGRNVDAWNDVWIEEGLRVSDLNLQIPELLQDVKVSALTDMEGNWNWNLFHDWMPTSLIQKIAAVPPPAVDSGDDKLLGTGTDGEKFVVTDMYNILCGFTNNNIETMWVNVWNLSVPERIKFFMWKVCHERILTNDVKARMRIDSGMCIAFVLQQ
jgi:hypothetical protein